MTIDTSYLNKYAYQSPLEANYAASGTNSSSGLYCIDVNSNYDSLGGNPFSFDTQLSLGGFDYFNYSPCFGIGAEMPVDITNSYLAMPQYNDFSFGNVVDLYNSYLENIRNNFKMPSLQNPDLYVPKNRALSKKNNADYIKELNPAMQEKVRMLEAYAKSKGYPFKISSGYRTRDEQINLQKKYASQKGRVAGADTSRHRFGKAIDISVKGVLTEAQCADLGRYAESIGMRWGGKFDSYREPWHFDIA